VLGMRSIHRGGPKKLASFSFDQVLQKLASGAAGSDNRAGSFRLGHAIQNCPVQEMETTEVKNSRSGRVLIAGERRNP
jgi:hypothetical protein